VLTTIFEKKFGLRRQRTGKRGVMPVAGAKEVTNLVLCPEVAEKNFPLAWKKFIYPAPLQSGE